MRTLSPLPALVALALLTGCGSVPASQGVDLARVLQGPYELRLALDRASAAPGETVTASIEFENTGRTTLWIPRQREVFFGFEQTIGNFSTSRESGESSCDGLEFVPVRPGRKVKYEKAFPAPDLPGPVTVHITANRQVTVPLMITGPR